MDVPSPKTRPTEYWLGVWTAAVLILEGAGVDLDPKVVAGVGTIVAYAVTWFASRDSNTLGP
jgi:hypothetical protein